MYRQFLIMRVIGVWGFVKGNAIERVHLQFCERLLGVKKTTQNDFIYLGNWEELATKHLDTII